MLIVDVADVGTSAVARMLREGIVTELGPRSVLPCDIESTPAIRALSIAALVPRHTVLSGLAGLWVWRGGTFPLEVTVVGERGLHRTASARVGFHSGLTWRVPPSRLSGARVAPLARCCVDALRWEDHRAAIVAVAGVIVGGSITVADLDREVAREDTRGGGYRRLNSVWGALRATRVRSAPHEC